MELNRPLPLSLMCNRSLKKFFYSGILLSGLCVFIFAQPVFAQTLAPTPPAPPPLIPSTPATPPAPTADESEAPSLPGEAPVLPGEEAAAPDGAAVPNFFGSDGALAPEPGLEGAGSFNFEKSEDQLQTEARSQAFDSALQGLLPLRPEEIRTLLEHFDRTQESVELPVYPSPKPEVAVETVSLDPGAKPLTVLVAYGNVSTVTILDMTGSPWPIQDISWAGNFEVVEASSADGSHIIRISPQSEFATGNMSIRLLGLKTPVIISLETSREKVHYRFDAIIPEYGPLAEAPLIDNGVSIAAGDVNIASVLQGIPPGGAKKLDVSGVDGRTTAYSFNGQTYIRTPLTLLSPSWNASVASADGMRVYSIKAAPVLLFSDKGKMLRARVAERQDILE